MRPHTVFAVLCGSILAGCVTVSELRQTSPVRVGTVLGPSLPLATCVMDRMARDQAAEGMRYEFRETAGGGASIVGIARFPGGLFYTVPTPLLELRFSRAEGDTVKIEARRSAAGAALELRVWPLVEQCAGRSVAVTPPIR